MDINKNPTIPLYPVLHDADRFILFNYSTVKCGSFNKIHFKFHI